MKCGYLKFLFTIILHTVLNRQKEAIESNHQCIFITDKEKSLQSSGPAKSTDEKKKTSGRELTTEKKSLEEAEVSKRFHLKSELRSQVKKGNYHRE